MGWCLKPLGNLFNVGDGSTDGDDAGVGDAYYSTHNCLQSGSSFLKVKHMNLVNQQ